MGSIKWFLLSLHEKRVFRDEEDKTVWIETKSGKFSVKSLYSALELGSLVSFPMNIIWNSWAMPKVGFFA